MEMISKNLRYSELDETKNPYDFDLIKKSLNFLRDKLKINNCKIDLINSKEEDKEDFKREHKTFLNLLDSVSNYDNSLLEKVNNNDFDLSVYSLNMNDDICFLDINKLKEENEKNDFIFYLNSNLKNNSLVLYDSSIKENNYDRKRVTSILFKNLKDNSLINKLNIINLIPFLNNFFFNMNTSKIDIIDVSYFSKNNILFNVENKNFNSTIRVLNKKFNEYNAFLNNKKNTSSNLTFRSLVHNDLSIISDSFSNQENIESFIDIKNFNLSGNINALPSLTVKGNLVNLDHSMYVKNFRDEELFYLSKMGLSKKDSKKLIIKEFISSGSELNDFLWNIIN